MAPEYLSLIIAAGASLLSFASPCVVPLVPGYLGYLSGATVSANNGSTNEARTRMADRRQTLVHAMSFVLGFTLVFTAMGASVGLIGYAARALIMSLQVV